MAVDTRDNLGRLPNELFYLVVEDHGLSTRDLAALAATCRKCYTITNPILYQKHIKEEDSQALMWAVRSKRFKTITRLLENGADINSDRMFRAYLKELSALLDRSHWAFKWESLSIFTPLAFAAALGEDSMVAFLLDHGADIEKRGKGLCECSQGENTVHLSFPPEQACGWWDDSEYIMDDENGFWWTPLHIAMCRGFESTAMLLLDRGANFQVTCFCEAGPWNALHTATRMNQRKIIDYLLDNKLVDINEAGHQGLTPLHLAFYEKHYSLVDMYIDRGADINAVWNSDDGGWTIFAMACLRDEFSRASDLLRRGADPDFVLTDNETGNEWTALGLIYGNLYGSPERACNFRSLSLYPGETHERRMLEKEIIQAKLDKAMHQKPTKFEDISED